MFAKFYENEKICEAFIKGLDELGLIGVVSPAALQGHFVLFRNDAQLAVDNLHLLQTLRK